MDLILGVIADFANVDASNKLNIIGSFSDIHAPSFPHVHPSMHLVGVFEAPPIEAGATKQVRVALVTPDGLNTVFDQTFPVPLPAATSGTPIRMNIVIQLVQTKFEEQGDHHVQWFVNGGHKRPISLRLHQIQAKGSQDQ